MKSVERVQARTACTMAELQAWGAGVVTDVEIVEFLPGHGATPGHPTTTWPPCLGCGGRVRPTPDALTIRTVPKGITFHPCGCALAVTDMPDGWRP